MLSLTLLCDDAAGLESVGQDDVRVHRTHIQVIDDRRLQGDKGRNGGEIGEILERNG